MAAGGGGGELTIWEGDSQLNKSYCDYTVYKNLNSGNTYHGPPTPPEKQKTVCLPSSSNHLFYRFGN